MARTAYWETMNAAIPAEAASAHAVSLVPPTASKHTRASRAGPTKLATLKTAMYQRGRERNRLRDEGDEDRQRGEGGRQEERRGEDRCQREMRALVLLPLGADEMHRRNDRDEDGEGTPVVRLGFRGERVKGKAGQGQPDDGELEGRRSRIQAGEDGIVASGPHDAQMDRAGALKPPNPPNG